MKERFFEEPKEKDIASAKPPESALMSRHGFLKFLGAAAVGTMVPEKIMGMNMMETKESPMSFQEGIMKLKKEVINGAEEVGANFHVDQKGKGSWENRGKGTGDQIGGSEQEIDFIKTCVEKKDQEVFSIHTHPLETAKDFGMISPQRLDALRKGDEYLPVPGAPPSAMDELGTGDLAAALYLEDKFGDQIKVSHMAVDAKGLWTYRPDTSHPFTKKYMETLRLMQKTYDWVNKDGVSRSLIDRLSEEQKINIPSILYGLVKTFSKELGPDFDRVVRDTCIQWFTLFNDYHDARKNLFDEIQKFQIASIKQNNPGFTDLFDAYKKWASPLPFLISKIFPNNPKKCYG